MKSSIKTVRRWAALLLVAAMLFALTACAGGWDPDAPKLKLNGKRLRVYTSHYSLHEEYVFIPLSAFLMSVGAEYADSPLNEYETKCISFMGNRYVIHANMHLFMLEKDYMALLKELEDANKKLSRQTVADRGLLPKNESIFPENPNVTYWGEIWTDNISLMNALRESGIDITIDYEYSSRTISVTLPDNGS